MNDRLNLLGVDNFFDLTNYSHRSLFDGCSYVWEALDQIGPFLSNLQLGQIEGIIASGAHVVDDKMIRIGKGTIVEPGAFIQGPCVIGENCTIRHGAYIRGNLITGDRYVIGHATEVKNAIFLNRAQAAHFAYVGDSILGEKVNLGAGTKCANLKLKGNEVTIPFEGERIKTGRRKFGVVMGDSAQTGCNSVTNPGTLMGKGSFCLPNGTVSGCFKI